MRNRMAGWQREGLTITPEQYAALNAAVATPEMREELRKRGFVAMGGTAKQLADWTSVQAGLWGPVLKAAGVKPE